VSRLQSTAALIVLAVLALFPAQALAASPTPGEEPLVTITFFYGEGCPYCAAEEEWLVELLATRPRVAVEAYEVWYDEAARRLYGDVAAAHGVEPSGVPGTFVAGHAWIGFSRQIAAQIEAVVDAELDRLAEPSPAPQPTPPTEESAVVDIPLIGSVDLAGQSLVVSTALIALVDGFNPCSLWVLSVLLAMMIHSGSRRRLTAVGVTFLLVTSAAYGLFMIGLVGIIGLIGYLWWVQLAVASIVLVFAVVAIKDYFWFGRGISFSIPDRFKPAIYRGSRDLVVSERPLAGLLAATAVLAAGVALLELPCTAGLPVLWSSLVADASVGVVVFGLLLGLYLLIYLLDELLLFGAVLITMRASRLQEEHGRVLKLVAGCVMLALAAAMILAPEALNTIGGTVAVFGASLLAAVLVLAAHRLVLPRFGIRIGNEFG
jgi:hypothetical protein